MFRTLLLGGKKLQNAMAWPLNVPSWTKRLAPRDSLYDHLNRPPQIKTLDRRPSAVRAE
jgi:hypothetical protein